jgi:hypothetical protein
MLLWVNRNYPEELGAWSGITGADPKASNQRKADFWTVPSIQTRSAVLDAVTDVQLNDLSELKSAVEATTDGLKKWEHVHEFWSDPHLPEELADLAREDNWVEYIATLSGLQKDGSNRENQKYIRVTKANLMAEIFGDDKALCLDSARRDILEPLFKEMFTDEVKQTHMGTAGDYRKQSVPVQAKKVWPGSKEFIENRLCLNPKEYRAITEEIIEALTEETGMTHNEVSHALFILGNSDGATAHKSLARMLD